MPGPVSRQLCLAPSTHSITSSARASSEGGMVSPTSHMRVTYLDATEHLGTVQEYKIMSDPGIVINGELAYTGSVSDTV